MAVAIQKQLKDKYPLALIVMGGAVVFAGQLLPKLRMPLDLDYIHATRFGAATSGGGIEWRVEPPRNVRDRAVLVLDDILDGGQTMVAIRHFVEVDNPLGHPDKPMQDEDIEKKFLTLGDPIIGRARSAAALEAWMGVWGADDIGRLMDFLDLKADG